MFFVLVIVAVLVFNITFNQFRVRIFVNDAFTARANIVLESGDASDLNNFFDEQCINNDTLVGEKPYLLYSVSRYDYNLEIKRVSVGWIAPRNAKVVMEETVTDIKGQFTGNSEEKVGHGDMPPEWNNAKYEVRLKKFDGRWYIVEVEKVKDLT